MTASTIIASQLSQEQWYAVFGESTSADAICDRLFHNGFKIDLKGDSMRKNNT
jgi:DNA replication protein DnaC